MSWIQLSKAWQGQSEGTVIQVDDQVAKTLCDLEHATMTVDPAKSTMDVLMQKASQGLAGSFQKSLQDALNTLPKFTFPVAEQPKVEGEKQKSFADWFKGVARHDCEYLEKEFGSLRLDAKGEPITKASLNTQIGSQGGFLVPTVFYPQLMRIAAERSIVRSKATIIPMASRNIQLPTLDITTAPTAGDTAFFGGLVARWTEEAQTMTEVEPVFKQIEMVAHELSGYTKASNQLLADNAVALESFLVQLFGSAIAWFEDYAFLRGDGVGKPLGVLNAGAAVSVTRNTAGQFKLVDAAKMLAKMLPGWNPATTCWCISPSVLEYLIQISDSAGNVIWIPSAREGLPMTLFGIPVQVTEKLPALGTAKDVNLIDFQHYLIGDRMQLEIAYSEHVGFLTNQGTWRFTHRVDGQPWIRSAITLSDATSTVSPFIYLT